MLTALITNWEQSERYCNLWITQGDKKIKHGFLVANLGKDQVILGHPWFKTFNPNIDWSTNQLKGETVKFETAGYCSKLHVQRTILLSPNDEAEVIKSI